MGAPPGGNDPVPTEPVTVEDEEEDGAPGRGGGPGTLEAADEGLDCNSPTGPMLAALGVLAAEWEDGVSSIVGRRQWRSESG